MSDVLNTAKDKVASTISSKQHLAAILPSKGSRLEITHRPTPSPGPNELLIEVKSIALNPIDFHQRERGFAIAAYPAVVGSDVAGIVLEAGSSVPEDAPKPGSRVATFAPCFFKQGAPDYGALQTRVLVPYVNAVTLPEYLSFSEGSLLPMAVLTVWSGWYSIGVSRETQYTPADKKGLLVWGAASSVGSAALQSANLMGFRVYATASTKHHAYLKGLGASRLFDYKEEGVVEKIIKTAKEDGVTIHIGYDAVGQLKSSLDVLSALKGDGLSKLAEAALMPPDAPTAEGVEAKFVMAPPGEEARNEHFHFVFGVWLKEKLERKEFVPSPKIKVIDGGLESANAALDELQKGVSGVKLVLEV
jgi:NADPH:quinone reductase-like Zn-dependent oxidoreductase